MHQYMLKYIHILYKYTVYSTVYIVHSYLYSCYVYCSLGILNFMYIFNITQLIS